MDGKETSQRSPGLCVGNGKTAPAGAGVTELVWSRAGPSGVMAWDLVGGAKAAAPASWRGWWCESHDRSTVTVAAASPTNFVRVLR
jgi:hypothetical protein